MSNLLTRKQARRVDLGLTAREFSTLARLATPPGIQAFLNAIPINHELAGETVHSVRGVLRHRKAHCIEGALLAACALWIHGDPPLVMHLDCDPCDYPHIVTLFRRGRAWGAISKSNGAYLRYRDQILPQALEVERMAEDSYRLGQTGIAALLQALQQSRQVRLQSLQTASDLQNALSDLERAIGAPIP